MQPFRLLLYHIAENIVLILLLICTVNGYFRNIFAKFGDNIQV